MKRLQAGMLVRLSCGSLCVITSPESSTIYAAGISEDGVFKRGLHMGMFKDEDILATAPKQDDKMFYRVAYAFGLPVRHKEHKHPTVASCKGYDFMRFSHREPVEMFSIDCKRPFEEELEELEKQQRELVKQQDKIAERMADVRSRMNKAEL